MSMKVPALVMVAAAMAANSPLARAAGGAEVAPEKMQGRTEAAIAEFRAAVALEPDLKHGAELFTACAECHAADGGGSVNGDVPAIAGQHVSVLVKQLVDFRHDRRWNERMQDAATQHDLKGSQDLLDVAAYAESLRRLPPLAGGTADGVELRRGEVIYHRDCAGCHGPLGEGELRSMRPRLAGQRYQYLLRQLDDTAAGNRPGMDDQHVKRIGALSSVERAAVADYVSRLAPDLASKGPGN